MFVLDLKEEGEEGTYINISHIAPVFEHEALEVTATLKQHQGHEAICSFTAWIGDLLVAEGETGQ